ncbi:hypothetical protein SANA_21970 [Gottschalkiaceae bacterium SANA]|nr:hypothetical protein SANA_21970 [Gottschalkiaceae bacterium SANA]
MHKSSNHKKNKSNGGIFFILLGVFLIFFQYFIVYNINGKDINQFVSKQINMEKEDVDIQVDVIDQLRTKYGLVILFQTNLDEKPIGYAVFKKDAIFDRYGNEDFVLYGNRITHNGDRGILVDLNHGYVFQFIDNEIIVISDHDLTSGLIRYVLLWATAFLAIAYGFVIRQGSRRKITKSDQS